MNVYEFVIGIIIVVTVGGLIRLKMGIRKDHKGNEYSIHEERAGKNDRASAETLVAALDGVLLASLVLPARRRRRFVSESVEQLLTGLGTEPT